MTAGRRAGSVVSALAADPRKAATRARCGRMFAAPIAAHAILPERSFMASTSPFTSSTLLQTWVETRTP